jgi:hypothetical protein
MAEIEESPISYEDLANIEEDFEEIDTEIGTQSRLFQHSSFLT